MTLPPRVAVLGNGCGAGALLFGGGMVVVGLALALSRS